MKLATRLRDIVEVYPDTDPPKFRSSLFRAADEIKDLVLDEGQLTPMAELDRLNVPDMQGGLLFEAVEV